MPEKKHRSFPLSLLTDGRLGHPQNVGVNRGDTVSWISTDSDITVSFPADGNPFEKNKPFKTSAARGSETTPARVGDHVPERGGHFECSITIGGKTFEHAVGVDTPGP